LLQGISSGFTREQAGPQAFPSQSYCELIINEGLTSQDTMQRLMIRVQWSFWHGSMLRNAWNSEHSTMMEEIRKCTQHFETQLLIPCCIVSSMHAICEVVVLCRIFECWNGFWKVCPTVKKRFEDIVVVSTMLVCNGFGQAV
jgi:hypothetical protein